MKKKILLAALMVMLCSVLIFFVQRIQLKEDNISNNVASTKTGTEINTQTAQNSNEGKNNPSEQAAAEGTVTKQADAKDNTSKKTTTKEETKNNTNSNKTTNDNKKDDSNASKTDPAKEEPNLIIEDTIHNKTLLALKVDFDGNATLYDILVDVLRKAQAEGKIKEYKLLSSGYIKSIDGLVEKKPEATSGWLYYVNGNKPDFGIKDPRAKFKAGSIVTIKFYKDAFSER